MSSMQPLRPRLSDDLLDQSSPTQSRGVELKPRRKNISKACSNCRERRVKCDGRLPECSRCVSLKKTCSYENSDRRKKEPWKSRIDDLQLQNEKLEEVIASLRCNSFPEAIERLHQLRSSNPSGLGVQSRRVSHSSASSLQQMIMFPNGPLANLSRNVPNMSLDMDSINLPPQFHVRRCVSAFFNCGSTLFYIMPREVCEKLLENTYQQPSGMDKCEICAVFSIAAAGSHYTTEDIPDTVKKTCFEYAASLLHETTEQNALMAMRASVGLAVCLVLLKSASARTMTASGLNTARWNMRKWKRKSGDPDRLEWARVFRTLAFLECWLSATLGYTFDLCVEEMSTIEELAVVERAENPLGTISPCLVQNHMYRIALASAQVQSELQQVTSLSRRELDRLSAMLDTWHHELPESLHLSSLIVPDTETLASIRRPILFMHMVHICARIALYERVIQVALNKTPNASEQAIVRELFWLSSDIQHSLSSFAQSLARIIRLLYDDECILSRCWLTIHASFHSSISLLLGCTRNLSLGVADTASTLDDLSKVHDCLLVLGFCKDHDIAATQLSDMVTPLYQRVGEMANDTTLAEKMRPVSPQDGDQEPSAIRSELDSITCQLVNAMETPFQDLWV